MLSYFKPIGLLVARLIIYSLVLVGIAQLLFLDAFNVIDGGKFSENSYTEWAQVGVLILIILVTFWTGKVSPKEKVIINSMLGFFLMALIREFDFYLDNYVFDGAWQVLAFSTLAVTIIYLVRNKEAIEQASQNVFQTSAFGLISAGILITFIFSRLYGRTSFWEAVMEQKYFRDVKNVSEEGIELLGYGIILIGCIELFRILLNARTAD
ncbi:MAG TPA: hypothetical protein VGA21_05135 [Cyclobacteriaceae bacterium]|jgi:hypothetical protein